METEVMENAVENQDVNTGIETTDVDTQDSSVQDIPQKYKIDDGEHTLEEIKQWREAHVNKSKWQKELTQKAQSHSQAMEVYEFLASDAPAETKWKWFEQNFPKQAAKMEAQGGANDTPQDYISKLEAKLNSLEQKYEQDRLSQKRAELESHYNTLRSEYKDKGWNSDVEALVRDMWIANPSSYKTLADAAKAFYEKYEKMFSNQQKNWINGKITDKTNPAHMPTGGGVPGSKKMPMTVEERKESLALDLFGSGD